ncbi:probable RGP1 Reduced growth phenotype protein [Phialocephala subalpina]|uniref:Probable RGP1 Reduced growth phenotype protein n=1 Tax=Phialocephala subalpina TaxID=576137 RepID=A0A1L7WJI7_9HELO|nr:probable RGP1 Reduced growth phenotype protein [Phialocephala subalpina]
MSTPLTNIRVFVQWAEQTVFAGEDIECQITFKNIANAPTHSRASLHPQSANGFIPAPDRPDRQRKIPVPPRKSNSAISSRGTPTTRGHRTTLSLSTPAASARPQPSPSSWTTGAPKVAKEGHAHKRSISIISIGPSDVGAEDVDSNGSTVERPRGPSRGHGRSASLQIVPRRNGVNGGPPSAPINHRSSTQPSPLNFSFFPGGADASLPEKVSRRQSGIATAPGTPNVPGTPSALRKGSASFSQSFRFPAVASPSADARPVDYSVGDGGAQYMQEGPRLLSRRSREGVSVPLVISDPAARILSPASIAGTPRSSGEFYSLSNNSTETLASEYLPQQPSRPPSYGGHSRRPSNLSSINYHRPPETLMMGYAQIHGSFVLDASLINQAPFEEVKRKGAVGGQGGGVIGVETDKRDSGLLRSFGWGSIGDSLGGLLSGGELSSIKDMRGIASSRSIPLLSTPQSILFVDLRLSPGETRCFNYSFKLPRGLPPSHRGKAIKISYKLVIGTQRPGGAKEQQVKSVEVPFRILGSVNSHGELLGHDLMLPYIILRDQAKVKPIETPKQADTRSFTSDLGHKSAAKSSESTVDDFLSYVDDLLSRPRQNSSLGLLSPTEAPRSRRQSSIEEPGTVKDAIDMAILRSNTATESQQSANRFEIARGGKRVAVVMLARPAYRLGETITAAIDFTDAEVPCYAIHMVLETSEKVDSSIALRSEASILRVTRKAYVSHSESTLFARRVVFSPTIPISATPEFITSGVSLDWRVRIEFVTPRLTGEEAELRHADLLEEVSRDDRGAVLAAAEALDCESFEVAVPLRVYGALAGNSERDDSLSDGLIV